MNISRESGTYGDVIVTWQLVPRDRHAFIQIQGQVSLLDLQHNTSIVIQVSNHLQHNVYI